MIMIGMLLSRIKVWRLFGRAQRLEDRGQVAEAIALYRSACSVIPLPSIHVRLALALSNSGAEAAALDAIGAAVKLAPDDIVCRAFHAILLADAGRIDEAWLLAEALGEAAGRDPLANAARVYVRLAKGEEIAVLEELAVKPTVDNPEVAARLFLRVERILMRTERRPEPAAQSATQPAPSAGAEDRRTDARPRTGLWAWLWGRSPRQQALRSLRHGVSLFERGRNEEAVALLQASFSAMPDNEEARLYLGCALFEVGRYQDSCDLLRPLARQEGEDELAAFYYGAACCKLGSYQEAVPALEAVYKGESRYDFQESLHYFLAVSCLGSGQSARARREFAIACDFHWQLLQERARDALQSFPPKV